MTKEYRIALSEVNAILKLSSLEVIHNVPYKLRKYIVQNMDKTFKANIDMSKNLENQDISNKAKNILALIYRDYLVSNEEKNKLIVNEKQMQIERQKQIRELYNPDNIFKKKHEINEQQESTAMVVVKEKNIFTKILHKIKSFFMGGIK